MIEWKNSLDLYNDYCNLEECPIPMQKILKAPQKSTPSEKVKIKRVYKNEEI